jgi:hypothetical protein
MTVRWAAVCLAVLAMPTPALAQANPIQAENGFRRTPATRSPLLAAQSESSRMRPTPINASTRSRSSCGSNGFVT